MPRKTRSGHDCDAGSIARDAASYCAHRGRASVRASLQRGFPARRGRAKNGLYGSGMNHAPSDFSTTVQSGPRHEGHEETKGSRRNELVVPLRATFVSSCPSCLPVLRETSDCRAHRLNPIRIIERPLSLAFGSSGKRQLPVVTGQRARGRARRQFRPACITASRRPVRSRISRFPECALIPH